jgi:hypothetical protein
MKTLICAVTLALCVSAVADQAVIRKEDYQPILEYSPTQLLPWIKKLNLHGIIFLDVTTKAHWVTTELGSKRANLVWLNVVYAIDQGYGYSSGPFYNTLTLLATGNGGLELYELILPGDVPYFGKGYGLIQGSAWMRNHPHPGLIED